MRQELKDRLNQKTTHPFWAKVRNVSGTISGIAWSIVGFSVLPPEYMAYAVIIATGTSLIAGGAALDKTKNKIKTNKEAFLNAFKK